MAGPASIVLLLMSKAPEFAKWAGLESKLTIPSLHERFATLHFGQLLSVGSWWPLSPESNYMA